MYPAQMRAVKSVLDVLFLGSCFFLFLFTFGSKVVSATPPVLTYGTHWEKTHRTWGAGT